MNEPPVRPCCMNRHWGPECPDGLVMCCLCFKRVQKKRLVREPDGSLVDVCVDCDAPPAA